MNNKNVKGNEQEQSLNADERDAANNATEDDYGEFEGADVEDEAPEAVQAHSSVGSPWATFPDLLRVPTSTSSSAIEDDPPESLTFTQRSRNGIALDAGFNIDSVFNSTGARPKTRPLAPPDISQIGSVASPSSSASSSSSSSGSSSATAGATASSSAATISPESNVPFKSSSFKVTSFPPKNSLSTQSTNSSTTSGISSSYSSQYKQCSKPSNINLSGAVSNFPNSTRSEQENTDLSSISSAINRLQTTIDTLTREMNSRLNTIEERLNNLTVNASSSSVTFSESSSNNSATLRMIREELQHFNQQQRQGIEEERSILLLTLSEAMRRAAATKNNHGVNGPR